MAYFHDAFGNAPRLGATVSSSIMTMFNLTSVLFTILATVRGSKKKSNPMRRVVWSLYLSIAAFMVLVASVGLRGTGPLVTAMPYYLFLLLLSVALAISQAFMQSGAMVICTQLSVDGTLMGYLQMGQALQGVFGSVVNFVSTVMAMHVEQREQGAAETRAWENASAATVVFVVTILLQVGTRLCLSRAAQVPSVEKHIQTWETNMLSGDTETSEPNAWEHLLHVQKRILPWIASIFCIFLVTLGIYPALTAQVRTVNPHASTWLEDASVFVALHIVLLNVGDLIGRRLPTLSPYFLIRRGWIAMLATTARFAFLPLFLACNIVKENGARRAWALPDAAFFGLVLLLGITTGCTATSVFLSGPKTVDGSMAHSMPPSETPAGADVEYDPLLDDYDPHENRDAAIASMLLAFWLVMGLMAGSCFSFVVLALT